MYFSYHNKSLGFFYLQQFKKPEEFQLVGLLVGLLVALLEELLVEQEDPQDLSEVPLEEQEVGLYSHLTPFG